MNIKSLINLVLMQSLWFGAIMDAAKDQFLITPMVLLLFLGWAFNAANRVSGNFKLLLVAVLVGLILDTTWINLGWLEFAANWPLADKAPVWILILWMGLALTLNHSLAWLQSRLLLAACLGGLFGPVSYRAAAQLGAVKIIDQSWNWFIGIGVSWAIVLPLLLWLARTLKLLEQEEQNHV